MTACPACAAEVPDDTAACPRCGAVLREEIRPTQKLERLSDSVGMEEGLLETLRRVTVGEFEIGGEIGRGGMATVFLAHDIALNRKVAIKVMSPELMIVGQGIRERFKREAQTAAGLAHPHIIPVYTVKSTADLVYFVMKYVSGRSLESVIREIGPLPISVVQTLLTQVGSALSYAHRKKVVHRDMKPANVMLDEEGWAVVTDFGIAKLTEAEALTVAGAWVGTPEYMSPEQVTGAEVTGAADQYSLGIMAFEMITGKQPFQGANMMSVLNDHCHTPAPSVLELRPDCPPSLVKAVATMLEKDPTARFPGMDEMIASIGTLGDTQETAAKTQMQGLVKRTSTEQFLDKFATPQSPVPRSALRSPPPPSRVARPRHTAPATRDGAVAAALAPAASSGTRRWPWVVTAVGALGVAALVLVQSGRGGGTGLPADPPAVVTAPVPVLAGLDISPTGGTIGVGESLALTAAGRDDLGASVSLASVPVTWETADPAVAVVSGTGGVTARAPGTTRITARYRAISAAVAVTVVARPVQPPAAAPSPGPPPAPRVLAVSVLPTEAKVIVGSTVAFTARVTDGSGQWLSPRDPATWSSSAPAVARVTPEGVVTAVAPGAAWVSATVRDKTGGGMVTVESAPAPAPTVAAAPPPPVPAAAAPAPVPPADPRPEIERVVERYRVALESRDLARLRAAYPGMRPEQERLWRDFFSNTSQLTVTLRIADLSVTGDRAQARLDAVYRYRADRLQTQTLTLTGQLERAGDGWRLTGIQ